MYFTGSGFPPETASNKEKDDIKDENTSEDRVGTKGRQKKESTLEQTSIKYRMTETKVIVTTYMVEKIRSQLGKKSREKMSHLVLNLIGRASGVSFLDLSQSEVKLKKSWITFNSQ